MNEKTNHKIAEALGIEPIQPSGAVPAKIDPEPLPDRAPPTKLEILREKPLEEVIIDEDFNEARENLKDIIEKTNEAISSLALIASESESPRAYEVLEKLLRQASDANDKLLNLSKQRKELTKGLPVQQKPRGADGEQPHVVKQEIQNAIFVGSSTDLDDLLEQRRNKKQEDVNNVQLPTRTISDQE